MEIRRSVQTVREWLTLFYPGDQYSHEYIDLWAMAEITDIILNEAMHRVGAVANLVQRLSETIEPDGSTLLDHTLIVHASHIGNGNHDRRDLSWFTLGDLNGTLNTGQTIHFDEEGRSHTDFWRTIARAMDVDGGDFGDSRFATGPIDEMLR